jgi:hypothetical protein
MAEDSRPHGHRPSLLFWGLIILVLLAVGFFIVLPGWLQQRIRHHEREASKALKLLVSAEQSFRAGDLDRNGVADYWTGDLAGLSKYGLIPRALAEADGEPLVPLAPKPIPYNGYYFKALRLDKGETPPVAYRQDTDKTSGKVHHLTKFGFVAWPAEWGLTGSAYFIVNENNCIIAIRDMSEILSAQEWLKIKHHFNLSEPPADWPTDEEMKWYTAIY